MSTRAYPSCAHRDGRRLRRTAATCMEYKFCGRAAAGSGKSAELGTRGLILAR
jgi:hypothetical protein